jgi:hypothetical protein
MEPSDPPEKQPEKAGKRELSKRSAKAVVYAEEVERDDEEGELGEEPEGEEEEEEEEDEDFGRKPSKKRQAAAGKRGKRSAKQAAAEEEGGEEEEEEEEEETAGPEESAAGKSFKRKAKALPFAVLKKKRTFKKVKHSNPPLRNLPDGALPQPSPCPSSLLRPCFPSAPPPTLLPSPPAPAPLCPLAHPLPSSDCWREIFSLLPPLDIARTLCAQPHLGPLAPPALWEHALQVSFPTAQRLNLDRGYGGGREEESAAAVYCCLSQGLCRLCFNSLADPKYGGDKVRALRALCTASSTTALFSRSLSPPHTPLPPSLLPSFSPSHPSLPTPGAALLLPP